METFLIKDSSKSRAEIYSDPDIREYKRVSKID